MRGTPNFKDGRSKFFNKSLPFGFRSPTLKLETEPKPYKGIPPRLRKDYPLKQKSARSSIENIERKYSDRKESDFVVVHKSESNVEWSKYFDVNNDNKLKAQKVFTNMIIHDIKNPALTIEQALENLEELIGIHDISEEDDVGAIDVKRKSLLEQTKSLCAGLKDSMGFMKSERIESGECFERISKYKNIENTEKHKHLLNKSPSDHITLFNQVMPNLDELFENIEEYPIEKKTLQIPRFSFCEEGVKHKQQSRSSQNREIKSIECELMNNEVSKVMALKSNNRVELIINEENDIHALDDKKQNKRGK